MCRWVGATCHTDLPVPRIDKVALGTAALYGLEKDNNLVGQQYSWLGSILSLGVSHTLALC